MAGRRRQTRTNTERARQLRTNSTKPENLLWNVLRNRNVAGLKFRRQFPIGPYFVDFACTETKLVVELDGESHEGRVEYDARRTNYLESLGFHVFRVTNDDVLDDVEAVAIGIAKAGGIDVVAWLNGEVNNPQPETTSCPLAPALRGEG
jgi:very-short-patch-repair endonuclease